MGNFRVFDGHDTENFASALLVLAMRQSKEFARKFLNLVLRKSNAPPIEDSAPIELEVERNRTIYRGHWTASRYPDISIEAKVNNNSYLVLVEAKIGALEQPGQIPAYLEWLDSEHRTTKLLATLTTSERKWQAKPHCRLFWREVEYEVQRMVSQAQSDFERSFWQQLKKYVEGVMQTFTGFSASFSDIHGLMRDVDLFLLDLLRAMALEKWNSSWNADRAAYWVPSLRATIGFYW